MITPFWSWFSFLAGVSSIGYLVLMAPKGKAKAGAKSSGKKPKAKAKAKAIDADAESGKADTEPPVDQILNYL